MIPHMGIGREEMPNIIPEEMKNKIEELKFLSDTPQKFLELAYDFLGNKYRSERLNTIFKFSLLFKDVDEIWKINGYIPCTQSNFLLNIFLVKSAFFSEKDIRRKYVFVNFIIHQYLVVRVENKWIAVDVGEKRSGMPIGKHLKYFG
jgi:hypothetical protein